MKSRYEVYIAPACVQLRDNRVPRRSAIPGPVGIVATFPTLGGGYTTQQLPKDARALARKIARLLNQPDPRKIANVLRSFIKWAESPDARQHHPGILLAEARTVLGIDVLAEYRKATQPEKKS